MPQVIVNGGRQVGVGVNGPVLDVAGQGDPNNATGINGVVDLTDADVGSTYHRTDVVDTTHQFYVKTAFLLGSAGTWTNK